MGAGGSGDHRWGRSGPLRETLSTAVHVVSAGLIPTADVGYHNQALSPCQVAAWQQHLRRTRPRYYGAMQDVLTYLLTREVSNSSDPDDQCSAPGLMPDFKDLLDHAFNSETSTTEQRGARLSILARLDSSQRLTTTDVCMCRPDDRDKDMSLLHRRQRIADAKWSGIDAASKVVGRRRPLRVDWDAPGDWATSYST